MTAAPTPDIAPTALVLPGLYDSGPEHWQTHWQRADASIRRVEQDDWATPHCLDWVARLEDALAALRDAVVLVAHSSSCAMVAHWAGSASAETLGRVRGALLVAPSDPDGANYPEGPTGFSPMPLARLPFPSIVVASTNDEYVTLDVAREYARAWGSELVVAGPLGHINSASGIGVWPAGKRLLDSLRAGA